MNWVAQLLSVLLCEWHPPESGVPVLHCQYIVVVLHRLAVFINSYHAEIAAIGMAGTAVLDVLCFY
jgi:hypothetical protein